MKRICCVLALALPLVAQAAPSWQSSMSTPVIELGVRDKYGELGDYTARFEVTGPNGLKLTKDLRVKAGEFGYLTFPRDFGQGAEYAAPGHYRWRVVVDGRQVVGGRFSFEY